MISVLFLIAQSSGIIPPSHKHSYPESLQTIVINKTTCPSTGEVEIEALQKSGKVSVTQILIDKVAVNPQNISQINNNVVSFNSLRIIGISCGDKNTSYVSLFGTSGGGADFRKVSLIFVIINRKVNYFRFINRSNY